VLSVNRFFLSALSAALPHVVPRDELVMANSISTTSGTIAALLGGCWDSPARNAFGEGNAATAGVLLAPRRSASSPHSSRLRMAADLLGPDLDEEPPEARQAVRHVVAGHAGRRAARTVAPSGRPRAGAITGPPLHLRHLDDLDDPAVPQPLQRQLRDRCRARGLALAVAASGAGFLLAAVLTPEATPATRQTRHVRRRDVRDRAVAEAFYVVGPMTEPSFLLGAFVLGYVAQGSKICVDSIVQTSVDDAYRGRVFAFYDVLFNVSFVAAAVPRSSSCPTSGYSRALFGGLAVGYALTAFAYGTALRRSAPPALATAGGAAADDAAGTSAARSSPTGPR
jgi:hypothetical protein